MKISNVHIHNFRSIRNIEFAISHEELVSVVLVGANDTGKSNILKALKFALIKSQQLQEEDYPEHPVEKDFPGNYDIWVELTFKDITNIEYRWFEQENLIRKDGSIRIRKIVKDIAMNREKCSQYQIYKEECNKWEILGKGSILLPKLYHLTASRSLDTETTKLATLLIKELRKQLNENELEEEIRKLEWNIKKLLDKWDPLWDVRINVVKSEHTSEDQETWKIHLKWLETDRKQHGDGIQHAVLFALLKIWSESKMFRSCSMVFVIEEPELFLHPHIQRVLKRELDSLVADSERHRQVFICSHSPVFINLEYYRSIFVTFKTTQWPTIQTCIRRCTKKLFDDDEKKIFNMTYWINPDRGELFFSRKVILVEGQTDKVIIPLLAKKLGIVRGDYTIIDCGGKPGIPNYINLLNEFEIPYVAVYDKDHQAETFADIENIINEKIATPSVIFDNKIEEEIGIYNKGKRNKPYEALMHVNASGFSMSGSLRKKIEIIYSEAKNNFDQTGGTEHDDYDSH